MDANGLDNLKLLTESAYWDYGQACYWFLVLALLLNIKTSNSFSVKETALALLGFKRFKKNGLFYVLFPLLVTVPIGIACYGYFQVTTL